MAKQTPAKHALANYDATNLERPAGDRWVTMSNALTRAGSGLSLAEKRIVMCAVSKLDSRKPYASADLLDTRITAAEYADLAECSLPTAYEALKDAAKALYNRSITFYEPAHKRNGKPLPPTMVQWRWIASAKYQKGEGWIELGWNPKLLPHLIGLKKQFTSYQLKQGSALRSIYSWRLLELLMRFESTGWAEYTIEDFRASMDAPPSLSDFGQVKRRIIEPAVKELIAKDGWLIQWHPVKAGRRVKAVRFQFERDRQERLPL